MPASSQTKSSSITSRVALRETRGGLPRVRRLAMKQVFKVAHRSGIDESILGTLGQGCLDHPRQPFADIRVDRPQEWRRLVAVLRAQDVSRFSRERRPPRENMIKRRRSHKRPVLHRRARSGPLLRYVMRRSHEPRHRPWSASDSVSTTCRASPKSEILIRGLAGATPWSSTNVAAPGRRSWLPPDAEGSPSIGR